MQRRGEFWPIISCVGKWNWIIGNGHT